MSDSVGDGKDETKISYCSGFAKHFLLLLPGVAEQRRTGLVSSERL